MPTDCAQHSFSSSRLIPLVLMITGALTSSAEIQNVVVGGGLGQGASYRASNYSPSYSLSARPVWALIDRQGNMLIKPQYTAAGNFAEGLANVWIGTPTGQFKAGFIDKTGRVVIEQRFEGARRFSDGLVAVRTEDGWGYIDHSGDMVIEPQYDWAFPFDNDVATVAIDDAWGAINREGVAIVPLEYDSVSGASEGLVRVGKNQRYGFVNLKNEVVIPLDFDSIHPFRNGAAPAKRGDTWGLINKHGEFVVEPTYSRIQGYPGGIFCVVRSGHAGVINAKGETIVPVEYGATFRRIEPRFTFTGGLLQLNNMVPGADRLWFNLEGQIEVKLPTPARGSLSISNTLQWFTGDFHEGLASLQVFVSDGNKYGGTSLFGYVDQKGKVVIPPKYLRAQPFSEGVAWVAVKAPGDASIADSFVRRASTFDFPTP